MMLFTVDSKRRRSFLRVLMAVGTVILLKLAAHGLGWEVITLSPLFSGIVAANVFILGFLLSGVLADYKESERLPGELACSIEAIADEARSIHRTKQAPVALKCCEDLRDLAVSIREWFYKRRRSADLMDELDRIHDSLAAFEPHVQANYIVRLKQELSQIHRMLVRIHTIRETSFIPSGYIVAECTTLLLIVGLILSKIDPFYESLFFVGVITFLLTFLVVLIRDLDNPFGHYETGSSEDISLKPLEDLIRKLGGTV